VPDLHSIYWPAVCITIIVAAYWGRVLRLVYKGYRRTGRSANFWPAEPLGRVLRVFWIPAIIGWIVVPLVVAVREGRPAILRPLWSVPILPWLATAVAFAAFAATLVCWKKMGKSWRMGIDPNEKTQLIVSGPYAYVRHPIYALSQILMLASVVAVPCAAMLAIAAIHLLFLQWEARREEQYLVATHGAQYSDYLRQVGRFIPRSLRAYQAAE